MIENLFKIVSKKEQIKAIDLIEKYANDYFMSIDTRKDGTVSSVFIGSKKNKLPVKTEEVEK